MRVEVSPELLFERIQELQERLDAAAEPRVRDLAGELVSTVVAMYGAGLERIFSGPEGQRLAGELSDDPLIETLLLHP